MKERSAKTGNTVTSVTYVKSGVKIRVGAIDYLLSVDSYLEFPCYVGKELSSKEKKRLYELSKSEELRKSALSFAKMGNKSEKQVKDHLRKKGYWDRDIDKVIEELKHNGLIDEEALVEDLVDSYENRLYGDRYIEEKVLKPRGLKEKATLGREEDRVEAAFAIYEKRFASYPYLKKKEKIAEALTRRGFSYESFSGLLSSMKQTPKEREKEMEMCKAEAKALIEKNPEKYKGRKGQEALMRKLLSRGYSMNEALTSKEEY